MEQSKLEKLLPQVESIARKAGAFIRNEFGKISTHDADVKSLNSLVSYVDIGAEKMIVPALSELYPEIGFITEEGTAPDEQFEYTWIVDPLDGTTNFLKGIPIFSVSIALTKGEESLIGVVYDIMNDWCFSATKGGGAFQNGHRVQVSNVNQFDRAVIATGFPYEPLHHDSNLFILLKNIIQHSAGIRRLGSAAIDLAYVACGKVEGYYEATLNSWDIAAGILLVQEAGGKVSDFDQGANMLSKGSVIASNQILHSQLQSIIGESL
jgi:myo-inositol-1(or 4)-monophosphatase